MAIRLLSSESISGALTLTGNLTGTSATFTGNVNVNGNATLGNATTDDHIFNGQVTQVTGDALGFKLLRSNGATSMLISASSDAELEFGTDNGSGTNTTQWTIGKDGTDNSFRISNSASLGTSDTLTLTGANATFAGDVTGADNFKATGANMKLWAGGTHVVNIDVNRNIYPQIHNSTDLGFSSALAFRTLFLSGDIISGGAATFGGAITATGITTTGSATFGSPLTIKAASPYIKWENAAGTRLAYIQHNETNLVVEADTGIIILDANTQIYGTLGVSSNINTSGLFTAAAIDTNALLSNGTAADLHGRYLGQAIYGSGTGSGDNYGTVADVLRYKDIAIWRKNSSTNVWSNPSDGDALVNGNYAHSWGGYNMEPAYSEYVFYFSNTLGYSFISQTIIQHSTNGNSFNLYIERATSTTNPYDTTGWTTMVTQTGISSWPGITCNQSNWEVGGGYPGLFRIRLVPTWNNGNVINIGSFQGYGSYGSFSHAWTTLFDRSVNFQSKIGVGTNPSRALDVTQEALIQGAGNVNMGTLALGPRASGVGKWSTISGAHYNQSSGGGNGSGAAGIMMIGTYGGNGENDIYIGGGPYEMNAATRIGFYTHTTDTSTAGGSPRMNIIANGNVGIGATNPGAKLEVNGDILLTYLKATANSVIGGTSVNSSRLSIQDSKNGSESSPHLQILGNGYSAFHFLNTTAYYIVQNSVGRSIRIVSNTNGVKLDPGATAWTSNSDIALKENIKPLENVLDKIKDYRCVEYNLKESPEDKKIGFIAQDWVDDFPAIVDKDEKDMLGMKYTETIPVLLKAIQELKAEIEILKSK